MRTRVFAGTIVLCLLAGLSAVSQERGVISGVVQDAAGGPLPGVAVTLEGLQRLNTITDARGEFVFERLVPGAYRLRLTLAGFVSIESPVQVTAGQRRAVTLTMAPGDTGKTLTVTTDLAALVPERVLSGVVGGVAGGVTLGAYEVAKQAPFSFVSRYPSPGGESYALIDENPFRAVMNEPLSTFSIDVDTAAYANVRRFLNEGTLPPIDAVRLEELINYFRYDYPPPLSGAPLSVTTEVSECPWNPAHRLALVGLQARRASDDLPPRNLVFLIDVSGSMQSRDKLPLVRSAMRMLTDVLNDLDRVAIVVYAGSSGLVLPSTPGSDRGRIHNAIAALEAGGSTNGGAGIELAYRLAREHFVRGGINRVILATDGDFNVGLTDQSALVRLIEQQRESGVYLSVLGVGTGNLKDSTLEKLAGKGNGNYSYLDSLQEARRVLVEEAGATLATVAKDVKLQIEFNPVQVAGYRLIGYENRVLRNEDFNDDTRDAGEIGAGHSVTALFEIVPAGKVVPGTSIDPLKYQDPPAPSASASTNELLTVKIRYKAPDADQSVLIAQALQNTVRPPTANLGFASAVAEVGMLLRKSAHAPSADFASAIARARRFRGADADGYRAELVKLAELASSLSRLQTSSRP